MDKLKKITILKKLTKYFLFLAVMIILNLASLNNNLQPFGFATFFSLIWCNQNIFLISLIFLISNIILGISEISLICCIATIIIFVFFYFLHYKLKKPLNIWLIVAYGFLTQIPYLYFNINSVVTLFYCLAYIAVGIIFLLSTLIFFQAIVKKKLYNFSLEESVCAYVFLAIFTLGLSTISFFNIYLVQIFAILLLLFLRKTSKSQMLLSAIVMGLGASLNSFYVGYLFIFCSYALIIWVFFDKNPLFLILGLIFIDLFVGLYLQVLPVYYYQSLIGVALGSGIFYLIPSKIVNNLCSYFLSGQKIVLTENIVNISTKKTNRKLLETAEIFNELENLFYSMSKGNLSEEEIVNTISQEIIQKTCQDCKEKNNCLRINNKETIKQINNLVLLALKKGKLTLMDVEDNFSKHCIKLNTLIPYVNELIIEYKRYENNLNKADYTKNIIARSLGGVSVILQELAQDISADIKLETNCEKEIQEELAYESILCREILIYEREFNTTVALLINNNNLYKNKITNIVSNAINMKMNIVSVSNSETPNYSTVILKVAPKFDIIYGLASTKKAGSESSGDTHSFNRIDDNKFLFALCDGMGSGNNAKKASELSIGIIENLYKAGFKTEAVIDCANNFLTMASTDVFTAIDLGVLDLQNGLCDIIKIGAPIGFVKKGGETKIIDAGALPMGILDELKPVITKIVVEHGDNIIFITDGVLDAFENEEILKHYINNSQIKNPQTLAENILNEAIHLNNEAPNDDMTVFVVRILSKKS